VQPFHCLRDHGDRTVKAHAVLGDLEVIVHRLGRASHRDAALRQYCRRRPGVVASTRTASIPRRFTLPMTV
jgi:hypothetical protein